MIKIGRRDFLRNSLGAAAVVSATTAVRPFRSLAAEPRKPIKFGQIGTAIGGHAPATMQTMRRLSDDFEAVGLVVESDGGVDANHRAFEGLPRLSEAQLLEMPEVELVVLEGAVDQLCPVAARVIAAGKHVHIEKPGSMDHPSLVQLLDGAKRRNLVVQFGYWLRELPAMQFLYQAVRDGWLGEIYEIHGVMSKVITPAQRSEFTATRRSPMFDLGCYLLDTTIQIMGQPEKVTPFAVETRSPKDGFFDNQVAVLEYPRCLATVRSTYADIGGFARRQISVCGEEGQIEIRPLEQASKLQLTLNKPRDSFAAGTQSVPLATVKDRLEPHFRELARTIRGEADTPFDSDHNRLVHKTVLAACDLPLT